MPVPAPGPSSDGSLRRAATGLPRRARPHRPMLPACPRAGQRTCLNPDPQPALTPTSSGDKAMPHVASQDRYDAMPYRRCGRSGLRLPSVSLGLWQNFGETRPLEEIRAVLTRAFDLGITHFDLANNYGPPYGSAETNLGRGLGKDLRAC